MPFLTHDANALYLSILLSILVQGCGSTPKTFDSSQLVNQDGEVKLPCEDYDAAFEVSQIVLKEAGFDLGLSHFRLGKLQAINTQSIHLFSFWSKDYMHVSKPLERTFNHTRRRAEINLIKSETQACYLGIKIFVEIMEVPDRQLTGSHGIKHLQSNLQGSAEAINPSDFKQYTWRTVGRDHRYELTLMKRIAGRIKPEA